MSAHPTTRDWDAFFTFADEAQAMRRYHALRNDTVAALESVASYIRARGLDLPPAGPCAGCVYHEINAPDGGVGCLAGGCIEEGEAV